jgi:hypothetical protein
METLLRYTEVCEGAVYLLVVLLVIRHLHAGLCIWRKVTQVVVTNEFANGRTQACTGLEGAIMVIPGDHKRRDPQLL